MNEWTVAKPGRRRCEPCWRSTWLGHSLPANCRAMTADHYSRSAHRQTVTHN